MDVLRIRVWHLLVLVAACAGFLAVFQYRRAVYDPTSARLRQVRYADADTKVAAIRELMDSEASGFDVIQTLVGALGNADPAVRAVAAQAMAVAIQRNAALKKPDESLAGPVRAALIEALRDPDPTVRLRAASGLASTRQLKGTSKEGFAILLRAARTTGQPVGRFRAVGDADDRADALWVLGFAYRDLPEARSCNSGGDERPRPPRPHLRHHRHEPLPPHLGQQLVSPQSGFHGPLSPSRGRCWRAQKMARRVVPVLIRDLVTRHPTPVWCVRTLGELGLEADQALPALRALADDTSRAGDLRFAAQKAVEAIDKVSRLFHEETLPDLIAKLGDDDPEIRASAAAAMARHGSRAKAAVPALARALDDPDPNVQRAASAALGVYE